MLKITEAAKSDISTVYAYFANPTEFYKNGSPTLCEHWSVFNREYEWGKEREFIAAIDAANPGKYSHYHIAWDNCN